MPELRFFKYETDEYDAATGVPADGVNGIRFIFRIKARRNINAADIAGLEPSGFPSIAGVTLPLYENVGKAGLHPRYVELAREVSQTGGSECLIQKGDIFRKLPILTETRFNALVERNEETEQPGSAIVLGGQTYRVVRKVGERRDNEFN